WSPIGAPEPSEEVAAACFPQRRMSTAQESLDGEGPAVEEVEPELPREAHSTVHLDGGLAGAPRSDRDGMRERRPELRSRRRGRRRREASDPGVRRLEL